MITTTLLCPPCESAEVIRYGRAPHGKQRFRCGSCTRTFRENPSSGAYPEERKREILAAYQERASLRGLSRIFGARAHHRLGLAEGAGSFEQLCDELRQMREQDVSWWTSGSWEFSSDHKRRWNELQNTGKDIRLLTDYLRVKYHSEVWDKRSVAAVEQE